MEGTGSLIRRLRMERKLSQQALCKGICAVSYLSKIEKGTANPGEEIVSLLFARLDVDFHLNEAFLNETRQLLSAYFEHVIYMENADREREQLLRIKEQALQSPLADVYTLFQVFDIFDTRQWNQAKVLISQFQYHEDAMNEEDLYFYALARGQVACDETEGMSWFQKAVHLRPYSIGLFLMAECLHHHGKYQEAIKHLQAAYARAAEEGNPMIMLYTSNLTAISYSDLYQEDLMLQYFKQAQHLARRIDPLMIPKINYNIGATLVSMRKSAEAMLYLLRAEEGRDEPSVLLYHKLAIACFDTGDRQSAQEYLQKADAFIKTGKATPMEEKLIEIVRFRLQKDYRSADGYYQLLREVYDNIDTVYHHGFKQFHGNLLIEVCVYNRRYKEALQIAGEVEIFPEFINKAE